MEMFFFLFLSLLGIAKGNYRNQLKKYIIQFFSYSHVKKFYMINVIMCCLIIE